MRMNSKLLAAAFAVAATTLSGAAQAQTVDVRVIGQIKPTACTPTLGGGGVIDYGNIPASTINKTGYTMLDRKIMPFSVQCDAPIKFALKPVDNRASSQIPGLNTEIHPGSEAGSNYGLGTHKGAKVGGYVLRTVRGSHTADGKSIYPVLTRDNGQSWEKFSGILYQTGWTSWSDVDGAPPIAVRNLSGSIDVRAAINKGQNLPLEGAVPIDGNATLEILYL